MRHVLSDMAYVRQSDVGIFLEGQMAELKVMRRDFYDANDDGIVDHADEADALKDGVVIDGGTVV